MAKTKPVSGNLDINIEDNQDYSLPVVYKIGGTAVDVTGYTATFTLVDTEGESKTPLLVLTEVSGISVGTTNGTFTVQITDAQAQFGNRVMKYDLVVVSPTAATTRLLNGTCTSSARAKQ